MIAIVGEHGRVELVNRTWERSLGWTLHELEEQHLDIYALAYPDPQYCQQVLDFVAAATGEWTDLKVRVRDGRVIDITVAIVHLSNGMSLVIAQDITERKQAEAAIRSLLQISEKLHATLDIDALLAALVIEAMELIDAEIGWSGLRSSEGMVCHTHITRDLQVVPFEYFLPPSVGLPGWVLVHKVPYVMNDAQADKLIIPEIRERFGVKALIDTPILDAQGEVIGFFEVGNKKNGAGFSESDVEKLVAVSRIASIALQNAMSYRNLERAEKALRESQLHLQLLSRQLLQAQEAERRSIARELHDEIGQQLTALSLILTSEHPSPDQLSDAHAVVRGLIDRLRNLSLDLRPTILDDLGLIPALVWLFERYTSQTTVSVRFEHSGLEEQRFDPEVETTAYRIVQEALTNVARHAGVREVTVRLWIDDDTLSVMIVDGGRGFDPQRINTRASSGLAGMQERAALLGGEMTIESAVGEGTRLTVTLPLQGGTGLGEQEQGP
jgi:PAS domain S-box-containing protein